jgi:phosphate-selective porin
MRAEFLQMDEQRKGQGSQSQDIPDIRGRGWTAGASYVLTGEKKGSTVEVEKSVFRGGRGALEIAARVEGLKFDDTGDPSGFAGFGNRASNIAASGASVIEAGLNYWAANYLKFQFGALWEKYNDPLIAPVPGNTGRYFTLQGRVQVMVP